MQGQIRTISLFNRFETSFINVSILKSRLYRINCYFYKSSLIPITRLFYRLETSLINVSVLKPRLYRMNCYFCKSSLVLTFRHYSQSLDIIRKALNISFFHVRKCFLLIVNALCAIVIIIIITFKAFSKHLNLNNAPRSSDLYHYRNLSTAWNDLTRGPRSRSHAPWSISSNRNIILTYILRPSVA